jgi:hypothetical protein
MAARSANFRKLLRSYFYRPIDLSTRSYSSLYSLKVYARNLCAKGTELSDLAYKAYFDI